MRGYLAGLLTMVPCALAMAANQPVNAANDAPYTHAQRLVDIDHGRRLNLYCIGQGTPTVVFDAGLGGSSSSWDLVQPYIAATTRACSYDRAGLGFSDPGNRPGTSANEMDDLHQLLQRAGIKPPYLLVGHSLGGMNVRLYADRYPSEVVGMVLVDPSHEDQSARGWALDGPDARTKWDKLLLDRQKCVKAAKAGLVAGTDIYKQCMPQPVAHFSAALNDVMLANSAKASSQQAVLSENENIFYKSADEVRAARHNYGSMPLIVLTHSPFPRGLDETQEQRDQRTQLWETMHDELASLSTRGMNWTIPDSGHYIQWDQPRAVEDAILECLADAQKRK